MTPLALLRQKETEGLPDKTPTNRANGVALLLSKIRVLVTCWDNQQHQISSPLVPQGCIMVDRDLRNDIIQRLLSGAASAPEMAEGLATSEKVLLPVLDQLRADHVVESIGGDWSLSERFRSALKVGECKRG